MPYATTKELRVKIVKNVNAAICRLWKDKFMNQREEKIPKSQCRICNRIYFADKVNLHNETCVLQLTLSDRFKPVQFKLNQLIGDATEVMLKIEKKSLQTPNQTGSLGNGILNTPTLQRRKFINNSFASLSTPVA